MSAESFIETYRKMSEISELQDAQILSVEGLKEDQRISIEANWRSRDLVRLKFQHLRGHYVVQKDQVTEFPFSPESEDVVLQKLSPSGKQRARVLQNDQIRVLQIIGKNGQIKGFNLMEKKLHGKVYCDPYISCLEWSTDESKIAYVAEEQRPLGTTYYDECGNSTDVAFGQKNLFVDDWGEQMVGQHKGIVVTLDIETGATKLLPMPKDLTPGELLWVPFSSDIVGVANISKPYKIGLAYCSDRESLIFKMSQEGDYEELTERGMHVKSPRFDPSGITLVYQKSFIFGMRAPAAQLWKMNWETKKQELIFDYVNDYESVPGGNFRGLCGQSVIPKRCFDNSGRRMIISAFDMSSLVMYAINIDNRTVSRFDGSGSCIVLDVFDNWLLVTQTSISAPKRLYLAKLPEVNDTISLNLNYFSISREIEVSEIKRDWWSLFQHKSPTKDDSQMELTLSALYFGPTKLPLGKMKRPLICWPHGGPHSLTANAFNPFRAFFVSLGYSIVFPNYRGSVGHGNDFLSSSLGQCGIADVEDCYISIEECLKRFPDVLDKDRIYLIGISHGGFLSAHLASQYPNKFKASCILNPATDIYSMATASDIPEWAFLEYGLTYKIGRSIDRESVLRMFERSPVHTAEKVKTPTLICLGSEDVRVPPSQGLNYHKLLIANNIPTRLYIYKDNHPLLKVSSESDYVIQIAKWFQNYS